MSWELLSAGELAGTDTHYFRTFGNEIRWGVRFAVDRSTLTGSNVQYDPGSSTTPSVTSFTLSYGYTTEAFRFTRSGVTFGKVKDDSSPFTNRDTVFAASTLFPGFTSTVKAYDVSGCTTLPSRIDDTSTCSDLKWGSDVETQMQAMTCASRVILTAYDGADADSYVDDRLTVSTPLSATLQTLLGTDNDDDWTFVCNGNATSSTKKIYDIGHATPVLVGPPSGSATYFDPGGTAYSTFVSNNASRDERLFVNANSGMLHCFDADSGAEEWAFVPYSVAPRVKSQRDNDSYLHQHMNEGPVVVQDVYDGSAWRTILVAGLGRGGGGTGANAYYALDITSTYAADSAYPKPLWEFGDSFASFAGFCREDNPLYVCSLSCGSDSCDQTCDHVTTTLSSAASAGATQLVIQSADYANFPSAGTVHLDRNDGSKVESLAYGSKTSPNFLNLTGSVAVTHSSATIVYLAPAYVVQESSQVIAMESEDWHKMTGLDGSHYWDDSTTRSGYTGSYHVRILPDSGGNCTTNVTTCGARNDYVVRFDTVGSWDAYFRTWYVDTTEDSLSWGVNSTHLQENRHEGTLGSWFWSSSLNGSPSTPTTATFTNTQVGLHTFNLWMREDGASVDKIVLLPTGSSAPTGTGPSVACDQECTTLSCSISCTNTTFVAGNEWPSCGDGLGYRCCSEGYCYNKDTTCPSTPDTEMGESFSPPSIGRFTVQGAGKWLVFFASGYNNTYGPNVGRSVYAVDAITGTLYGRWGVDDIAYNATTNPSTIYNAIPGGVTLVDLERCEGTTPVTGCGYVDRAYFGDLEGRLWKIDTSANATLGGDSLISNWSSCKVFDAGDPDYDGTRTWAPIVTKPAVAIIDNVNKYPNIYFGTGGHDGVPTSLTYRFYSVRDKDTAGSCMGTPLHDSDLGISDGEFIIGDGRMNDADPVSSGTLFASATPVRASNYEGDAGDTYWADPIIVNNTYILFASWDGDIRSVDPCAGDGSDVYTYALRTFLGTDSVVYKVGAQMAKTTLTTKVRQPAVFRGVSEGAGYSTYGTSGVARNTAQSASSAPEMMVQGGRDPDSSTGTPEIRAVAASLPGVGVSNLLIIRNWREIPL
jgi:hypothetical protein